MIFLLCIREIISKLLFMQEPTIVCMIVEDWMDSITWKYRVGVVFLQK